MNQYVWESKCLSGWDDTNASPGVLAGCIPEKGPYTAGVKATLRVFPFFVLCFWHYAFLKNILIQPTWMSFLYSTHYFQGKISELIFVSSCVISVIFCT